MRLRKRRLPVKVETWAKVGKCGAGVMLMALFGVSSCNSPGDNWIKEGVTQDELKNDQGDCATQSSNYNFLVNTDTSGQFGVMDQQADVYQDCMAKKGYTSQ